MSQWPLTKKIKKARESCVRDSYENMKNLVDVGKLDHIPVPLSPLAAAKKRENNQMRFSF